VGRVGSSGQRRPVAADSDGPWLANCCRLCVKSGHECGGGIRGNKERASKVLLGGLTVGNRGTYAS
jgi:hypothetical protein